MTFHSSEIDKLHQDTFIEALHETDPDSAHAVQFLEGTVVAERLIAAIGDDHDFLELQQQLIYRGDNDSLLRPVLYNKEVLMGYLLDTGLLIQGFDHDSSTGSTVVEFINPGNRRLSQRIADDFGEQSLPEYTTDFYQPTATVTENDDRMLPLPRVLNIGSGHDPRKKIREAINIDLSPEGSPEVVASATALPFPDGWFSVVMGSHVLEHFEASQVPRVLAEWKRVLHPRGLLRIAVPDALITLNELKDGYSSKGQKSYAIPGGSAALTQLVGLGAEHSKTDPRWLHRVLFSDSLLRRFLKDAGFGLIAPYQNHEALSEISGIKIDETNRYSLKVEALQQRNRHIVTPEINQSEYEAVRNTVEWNAVTGVSVIVPVRNEKHELPTFLQQLDRTLTELDLLHIPHEVIFVINGSTDESQVILNEYAELDSEKRRVIDSDDGILKAFYAGVQVRDIDAYIAKLDVDTAFNHWTLPLLVREMLENKLRLVTYAESLPKESSPNRFNMAEFHQDFRTERNYYHGRFSLYRRSPFDLFPADKILSSEVQVEDIVLSCLFTYYCGLDSIGRTPGAVVRSRQPSSIDMLIRKFDRSRQEIERIEKVFPQLRVLSNVLKRVETEPDDACRIEDPRKFQMWSAYQNLHKAMTAISRFDDDVSSDSQEWERLR